MKRGSNSRGRRRYRRRFGIEPIATEPPPKRKKPKPEGRGKVDYEHSQDAVAAAGYFIRARARFGGFMG